MHWTKMKLCWWSSLTANKIDWQETLFYPNKTFSLLFWHAMQEKAPPESCNGALFSENIFLKSGGYPRALHLFTYPWILKLNKVASPMRCYAHICIHFVENSDINGSHSVQNEINCWFIRPSCLPPVQWSGAWRILAWNSLPLQWGLFTKYCLLVMNIMKIHTNGPTNNFFLNNAIKTISSII